MSLCLACAAGAVLPHTEKEPGHHRKAMQPQRNWKSSGNSNLSPDGLGNIGKWGIIQCNPSFLLGGLYCFSIRTFFQFWKPFPRLHPFVPPSPSPTGPPPELCFSDGHSSAGWWERWTNWSQGPWGVKGDAMSEAAENKALGRWERVWPWDGDTLWETVWTGQSDASLSAPGGHRSAGVMQEDRLCDTAGQAYIIEVYSHTIKASLID